MMEHLQSKSRENMNYYGKVNQEQLHDPLYLYHQDLNPRSHSSKYGDPTEINYYNSKYANLDAICGFDDEGKRKSPNQGKGSTAVMDNSSKGINIQIPYTYNYKCQSNSNSNKKSVPPPVSNSNKCPPTRKTKKPVSKSTTSKSCPCPPPVQSQQSCGIERNSGSTSRAFCSTVKSMNGPPRQGYIAKTLPNTCCYNNDPPAPPQQRQGHNKTSMKWDFEAGVSIPVVKVDYGEELYEKAARNLAKQLLQEKMLGNERIKKGKGTGKSSSASIASTSASTAVGSKNNINETNDKEEKCFDFSKPGFNSSLKTSVELAKALERLKNLPLEMERIFRSDKRFEPEIMNRATKVLNVPRESKVFSNLVPMDPADQVKEQVSKTLKEEVQLVKPSTRSRDLEPNILDYQELSFSRIKPIPVPGPSKPQSGVSLDTPNDYHIAEKQQQFEDDADRI